MAQDTIAVHWEVAAPREPHGRCASQWEEIRVYHKRTGYSDIAYSFGACQHGQIFSGRGWHTRSAATCNGHWNARAWSVCWMGGPGFTPTQEALRAIRSVVDEARSRGARNVIGHRQACATQCPGDFLMDWINRGLPVSGSPTPSPSPQPSPVLPKGVTMFLWQDTNKACWHFVGTPGKDGDAKLIKAADYLQLASVLPHREGVDPGTVNRTARYFQSGKYP